MKPTMLTLGLAVGATATAAPWTPTPEQAQVVRALSVRHDAPTCDALVHMLPMPTAQLADIADHVDLPPWVGIRAAACVTAQEDALPYLRRWLNTEAHEGIARVISAHLPHLSAPQRAAVLQAAEPGPYAPLLRHHLDASVTPNGDVP